MSDDRKHAPCSPSVLKRRINCPGSLQLEPVMPDSSNQYSKAGTNYHKLLELDSISEDQLKDIPENDLTAIMNAKKFLDQIKAYTSGYQVYKELEVKLEFIHELVGWGHVDLVFVKPFERAVIVDHKFFWQREIDPAERNYQLRAYAAGVCEHFELEEVEAFLFMPHLDQISRHTFSKNYLMNDFSRDVRKRIEANQKTPFNFVDGGWCHKCRAMGNCPIWVKKALEIGKQKDAEPTPKNISALLDIAEGLKEWTGCIQQYAFKAISMGQRVAGWGLQQGYGHRKWIDEKKAEENLSAFAFSNGKSVDALYDPKTLKSPAGIEKVIGKSKEAQKVVFDLTNRALGEMKLARIKAEEK